MLFAYFKMSALNPMSYFLGLNATCSVFEVSHGEGIWGVEETQQKNK